jgi:hypothetical protein
LSALDADGPINQPWPMRINGLNRASGHTTAAMYAIAFVIEYFRFGLLRFRITAPSTCQIATFQKDNGAYSRSVMYREFLYIKHGASLFIINCRHAITFSKKLDMHYSVYFVPDVQLYRTLINAK